MVKEYDISSILIGWVLYKVMEQDLAKKRKRFSFLGENGEYWGSDLKDSIVDCKSNPGEWEL